MMMAWSVPVLAKPDAIGNGSRPAWSLRSPSAQRGRMGVEAVGLLCSRSAYKRYIVCEHYGQCSLHARSWRPISLHPESSKKRTWKDHLNRDGPRAPFHQ